MEGDLSSYELSDFDVDELSRLFPNVDRGSIPQQIPGDNGTRAREIGPMALRTNEMFSTFYPPPNPNAMVRPHTAKTWGEIQVAEKGPPTHYPSKRKNTTAQVFAGSNFGAKGPPTRFPDEYDYSVVDMVSSKKPIQRRTSSKTAAVVHKTPRNQTVIPRKRPPSESANLPQKKHLKPKSKRKYVEGPTCPSGYRPWRGGKWLKDDPTYGSQYDDMCIIRRRPPPSLFINRDYVAFAK